MQYRNVENYLKPKHGLIYLTTKGIIEDIISSPSVDIYTKEDIQTGRYYIYKFNGVIVDKLLLDHNISLDFLQY